MVLAVVLLVSLSLWGYVLVSDNPLPVHVDGAVVLQGSVQDERARIAGAVAILRQGNTDRILLSVPRETYWGQAVAPIANADIEKTYGQDTASHIEFCETDDVDSTEEEAEALYKCINRQQWRSVAVVTSDYHTRRAGIIWRRMLRRQNSSLLLWIHSVRDPEFHASGWWRERRSAKTLVYESMKLVSTLVGI
jgi:uncharacterized SAM-binding protein YcdF (DUF218 family)